MHLAPVYFTTTRSSLKRKPSKSKKLAEATSKHEQWLRERGLHPEQRDLQRAYRGKHKVSLPDLKTESTYELSNGIGNGFKNGIMDNLHKEKPEVRKAILEKAQRTTVAYNKGPTMYFSPESDKTNLGSGSRRG
jgi:hypothetical protein